MEQDYFYNVSLVWDKDRIGTISSPALETNITVATPPEFPKGVAGIWSPEHLFVASANSCLMTTFLAVAENSQLSFTSFVSDASGKLEKVDGKYMITEIILSPTVRIKDDGDKGKAERVLQKSEAACLIANSMKSKIIFNPRVIHE